MIFFLPTATQWQTCPVLAARRIGFFFQLELKKEKEQEVWLGKRFAVTGNGARADTKYKLQQQHVH